MTCANCDGEQWVCEDHPEVPWGYGDGCCGGAGAPCICSPLHKDNWSEETKARHAECDRKNAEWDVKEDK